MSPRTTYRICLPDGTWGRERCASTDAEAIAWLVDVSESWPTYAPLKLTLHRFTGQADPDSRWKLVATKYVAGAPVVEDCRDCVLGNRHTHGRPDTEQDDQTGGSEPSRRTRRRERDTFLGERRPVEVMLSDREIRLVAQMTPFGVTATAAERAINQLIQACQEHPV